MLTIACLFFPLSYPHSAQLVSRSGIAALCIKMSMYGTPFANGEENECNKLQNQVKKEKQL